MDCGKIRKELHAYLDELATAEEKAEIEGHLASCPDCRTALEELKQTVQLLENLNEVEPPAWLTQRVMTRVRAESAAKEGFFTRLFGSIPMNLPAAAVATLVIAVTAVVLIKNMEPEIQETMQTAVTEQAVAPAQKGLPRGAEPGKAEKSGASDQDQAAREEAPAEKALPERHLGTALKTGPAEESLAEDRASAGIDNKTLARQQAPAALPAAPVAPEVSSAPKPATTIEERGAARGRAVLKDAHQTGQDRQPAKAKEEKAAGSLLQPHQRVVTERYANGRPRAVITYQNASGKSGTVMEERFDEQGRRHGLHRSYDNSGSLTAEVRYEHGEPVSVREFNADGTLRTGASDRNWPWLNPDVQ